MNSDKIRIDVFEGNDSSPIEDIKKVFFACDWGWPPEDAMALKAFGNSWRSFLAFDGSIPIGFARLISDGVRYALLVDTMIVPEHRRKGLGSKLLERVTQYTDGAGIESLQLLSTMEGRELYRNAGFEQCPPEAPGMHRRKTR